MRFSYISSTFEDYLHILKTKINQAKDHVRVGEVGGNTLGFYGGMFSPDGLKIIAHGYQGAFHHWSLNQITNQWNPSVTGGGHFESVEDIDWDRSEGEFLLSTSADQTTRLHAPWVHSNRPAALSEYNRNGQLKHMVTRIRRDAQTFDRWVIFSNTYQFRHQ
ncbi:hypothetical protein LOTGIDRAFT_176189 [Lottia gigantea]|uniref:E3 ubiquitin-protein ligase HECW1 helical box domain-containing protein n=1 Tax=Lottia gigantea TaxID=225164 RepID=V3ZTN9_LOTGI|nr:hypothetical protein LOTGIDRAFT_176189 [Lottia gigantea]ESO84286.1 hypothetical protein LOTGIDRAFT_176189 [Lottia gigantea]